MELTTMAVLAVFIIVMLNLAVWFLLVKKLLDKKGASDVMKVICAVTLSFVSGYFGAPLIMDLLIKLL